MKRFLDLLDCLIRMGEFTMVCLMLVFLWKIYGLFFNYVPPVAR